MLSRRLKFTLFVVILKNEEKFIEYFKLTVLPKNYHQIKDQYKAVS